MSAFQAPLVCCANGIASIKSRRISRIDVEKIRHLLEERRATPNAIEHRPCQYPFVHFPVPFTRF